MFAQISTTTTAATGIAVALITAIAAVTKKYLGRKVPKPDTIKVSKVPSDQLARLYDRIQSQKQLGTCQSARALLLDIGGPGTISLRVNKT